MTFRTSARSSAPTTPSARSAWSPSSATIDERAVRYAAVNAGTVEEYRRLANQPDEPRILLLIDGFGGSAAYEVGPRGSSTS